MNLISGKKSIEDLEKNSQKLSAFIKELEIMEVEIDKLQKFQEKGSEQLDKYEENLGTIEEKISKSVKTVLTNNLKENSKVIEEISKKISDQTKALEKQSEELKTALTENLEANAKSIEKISTALKIQGPKLNNIQNKLEEVISTSKSYRRFNVMFMIVIIFILGYITY